MSALAVVAPSGRRVTAAAAAGAAALGSAVALTGVSAWLVSRASQHPSIVVLSAAIVAVRALGISRGVFRYVERLTSHDVALRGTVALRERLYARLAAADRSVVAGLRHGALVARVGADVDLIGDVLVRGLLPFAVAAVVGLGTVVLVATLLPAGGAVLALCLALAAVLAPWLAGAAAARAHRVADESAADVSARAHQLLDHATEVTVAGRLEQHLSAVDRAETTRARALDDAVRPAALAVSVSTAALGAAATGCLVLGALAVHQQHLAPQLLAVVALVPLALGDVVGPLPAAAGALVRGSLAAARLRPLLHAPPAVTPQPPAHVTDPDAPDTAPSGPRAATHHHAAPGARVHAAWPAAGRTGRSPCETSTSTSCRVRSWRSRVRAAAASPRSCSPWPACCRR